MGGAAQCPPCHLKPKLSNGSIYYYYTTAQERWKGKLEKWLITESLILKVSCQCFANMMKLCQDRTRKRHQTLHQGCTVVCQIVDMYTVLCCLLWPIRFSDLIRVLSHVTSPETLHCHILCFSGPKVMSSNCLFCPTKANSLKPGIRIRNLEKAGIDKCQTFVREKWL